jgi:geranylgeranyl pyrophosphate synthase
MEQNIISYLEEQKEKIDKLIEKYVPRKATYEYLEFLMGKSKWLYTVDAFQHAVIDPIWDFLDRGGKRWRPVLFLLVNEALGGNSKDVEDFCIIPELIHNGTIIIDDIEDRGELRRGKPCLHLIYGEDIAINAGNLLYFLPLIVFREHKNKFPSEIYQRAYEIYIQEMINVSIGQATDIYWHQGKATEIKEEEYLQMCANKTGCLARMAAKLGAIFAGADDEIVKKIGSFAESIGVAFQIQDDILDVALEGKEREKFGKVFGNDIKEGKRTLMVIYTLNRASEEDKQRLIEILDKHTDDLEERREAIEILKKYGSIEYAKEKARELVINAWQEVEPLLKEGEAKNRLHTFAKFLIERQY